MTACAGAASIAAMCAATVRSKPRAGPRRSLPSRRRRRVWRAAGSARSRRDTADCESMTALADLMAALGSPNLDCRQDGATLDPTSRVSYLFNTTIAGIEEADAILLIGTNPRWEAALVNARIRKRWRRGGLKVGAVGPQLDLTYPCEHLGDGPPALAALATGEHPFAEVLKAAERPMLIVGMGALNAAGWRRRAGPCTGAGGGGRHGRGGLERLQRPAHGGGPCRRARSGFRAGRGRARQRGDPRGRRQRRAPPALPCWVRTSVPWNGPRAVSSSIRATTATPARGLPT